MLLKYVWSISAKKISFIRSCYGSNKSNGLHNKGPYTSGNIKWLSFALRFCVSNHKSAWQPLLPSAKGLSFTLCLLLYVFYLMQESRWSSPFPFLFYPLASTSCWKRSWYIDPIGCKLAWTIIVDITQRWIRWEAKL